MKVCDWAVAVAVADDRGPDANGGLTAQLKDARERHGLTQREMAERMQLSYSYYVKLEQGGRHASWRVQQQIEMALAELDGARGQEQQSNYEVAAFSPSPPVVREDAGDLYLPALIEKLARALDVPQAKVAVMVTELMRDKYGEGGVR